MKLKLAVLLFLSLLITPLFSEEYEVLPKTVADVEDYSRLINFEGTPNSVIDGCVNVITGDYFEAENDLVTAGANPVTIGRYFSSDNRDVSELYDFWDLNLSSWIKVNHDDDSISCTVHDKGVEVPYFAYYSDKLIKVSQRVLNAGVVNVCSPYASGKLHIKNKYVNYFVANKQRRYQLVSPGGDTLNFYKKKSSSKYFLSEIHQSNGCKLLYDYEDDMVNRVSSHDRQGRLTGEATILHSVPSKKQKRVTVKSDDGREVIYNISREESKHRSGSEGHRYCLSSVEKNFGPTTRYEYKYIGNHRREKLIHKELPNNRYLNIDYYNHGDNKGRVKSLSAPVGVDVQPVMVHKFEYSTRKADVYDAYGIKTSYSWTKEDRLSVVDEFASDGTLYRSEKFTWGQKETSDHTMLKARVLSDGAGKALFAKSYQYDDRGNILEEHLAGNLSGTCEVSPKIDDNGNLLNNGCEKFVKKYTYNADNLVLSENDGRQIVNYVYYPNTSLVKLKTVSDGVKIRQRYFYEYDNNGTVIHEVIDDGNGDDIRNLSGMTERHVKKITTTAQGLPHIIMECYFDLATMKGVLKQKTVNTYTKQGLLKKEEVYDSRNVFAYSKEWVYDNSGHVIEETDPSGRKTYYSYDDNGNCTYKQSPNTDYFTEYHYDFVNRLIKEEEIHKDGNRFSKNYSYDFKGNKVKATDIYGNETSFVYDSFGRVIKKVLPAIPDIHGKLIRYEENFSYNPLNHPVKKKNAKGYISEMKCNAYGKPTRTVNPDGSTETIIYNVDGTVKEVIDSRGTKTLFKYDYLQRKVREEKIASKSLSVRQWIYNAFHLMEEIDPEGNVTSYKYDGAGRLVSERKGDKETRYVYDFLGRQIERQDFYETGKYRATGVTYDVLNQVVEERIMASSGECHLKKNYAYDCNGNRTHEMILTDSGTATTVIKYNAHHLPIKVTAPDGNVTTYNYRYDYRNAWNQNVPYQQVIDPLGNSTVTIKSTHDQIAVDERKNIYGHLVQKSHYTFDPIGCLLRTNEEVIISGKKERNKITQFEYDTMGRETAIIEAYGEPCQKVTRKEYTNSGEVSRIIKPNGVVLKQSYDPLGRLTDLNSSDNSIQYRYTYDCSNNIVKAIDQNSKLITERFYDANGNMRMEVLDHGLKIEYDYDRMGRLKELTLPDLSKISYSYDAGFLREVKRNHRIHRYHYNISGKLKKVDLMAGLGETLYKYDTCLRPIEIKSNYWQMSGEYDSCGNIKKMCQSDSAGPFNLSYEYDSLHQLTAEKGTTTHTYQFDSLGNRTKLDQTAYANNSLNQLVKQGNAQYQYDSNGNLIKKIRGDTTTLYRYDALDRLIEATAGLEKTNFFYDPLHRRTCKKNYVMKNGSWNEVSLEKYLYQGDKELGAVDKSQNITHLRVMGIGCRGDIGAAVLLEIDGSTYIPLHDYRGNAAVLLDTNGKTIESYRYTAYGSESVYDSTGSTITPINPWRFSSKRVDPETGWSYFGNRYYDAEVGRWTTPDPLWFVDGMNRYSYVRNRPTQFIDSEGLFLGSLFEILKTTILSIFQAVSSADYSGTYNENCAYVCADLPVNRLYEKRSLDKQSRRLQTKEKTYGPVHYINVNGILNKFEDAENGFEEASKNAAGASITWVYNASHGLWDIAEAFINLLGVNTRPVSLLHKEWDDYFNNCPEDGIIIQNCHSQGTILTRNALRSYDPERRKRIHVIAVAPAAYIDEDICGSIIHYVSKRDFVPLIDLPGRWRNQHTTVILDPHPTACIIDHSRDSLTYQAPVRKRYEQILKNNGIK